MATKKAATKSSDSWKWIYLGGVIVAGLAGAFPSVVPASFSQILQWLLVLAGVLSGIFFLDSMDVVNFGIRYLLLAAVAGALGGVPAVGGFLSGFFGGVFGFLGPVGLTMLFMYFWNKYFSK